MWTNNYVILPSGQPSAIKTLGLKGRYCYISMCGIDNKSFTIHLDFAFSNSKNVRISISNIYKEEKYDHFSIQIPITLPKEKWFIICLDLKGYFDKYHCMKEGEFHFLRSVMLCANMKISRIATADKLYNWATLPRDFNFKLNKGDKWEEKYSWIEPLPCDHSAMQVEPVIPVKQPKSSEKKIKYKPNLTKIQPIPMAKEESKILTVPISNKENINTEQVAGVTGATKKDSMNPLISLQDVIGCSTNLCPTICWSKDLKTKELIYAAGNLVVISDLEGHKRFCSGHTKPIVGLCISHKGDTIASIDENSVRIWSFLEQRCLGSWKLEDGCKAKCCAISPDNMYLVTVSKDTHNHDVITVWNLNTMKKISPYQPRPDIVATQINTFNIVCAKFSPPGEPDASLQFCTCGQENIRFWRIKNGALRSAPIVLDKSSRNTVFTCLDYEGRRRVYVGSKEGTVLQINSESQELEYAYKLHDSGIYAISVNEGFCVTGSDDLYLRVWPLDFSEFFMEAKHEATVTSLDISLDGVQIICATGHGSIGMLDLSQQKYRTLARSHTDEILALSVDTDRLLTVSKDKTMRIWDLKTNQQSYEFCAFDDQALCAALCPGKGFFACGFESGCLRIFDIERTAVVGEYRMFDKSLIAMKYIGDYLVTVSIDGSVTIHNTTNYDAVKQVLSESPIQNPTLAVDFKSGLFATISKGNTAINVWNISPLEIQNTFTVTGPKIIDLVFLNEKTLAVLTADSMLKVYTIDGNLLHKRQIVNLPLNNGPVKMCASQSGQFLTFIGQDNIIRMNSRPFNTNSAIAAPMQLKEHNYHAHPVKSAVFHPENQTLFITAGGPEGIFIWRFQGNLILEAEEEQEKLLAGLKTLSVREDNVIQEMGQKYKSAIISAKLAVPVNMEIENSLISPVITKENPRDQKRKELGLPLKHYVSNHEDKQAMYEDISTRMLAVSDKNVRAQKLTGYNGNARNNIWYNPENDWIVFSMGHKLIIEEFASKKQEVYLEQEAEISCFCISPDLQYLACATGVPNKTTNIADIYLYAINNSRPYLKMLRKMQFYQKGVQAMCFSKGKLWAVGRYPENTISLWDITNGNCLASEILTEPVHGIFEMISTNGMCCPKKNGYVIARAQGSGKDWVIVMETITREGTEYVCGKEIEADDKSVLLMGNSCGNISVCDPMKGALINEYPISDSEISCIEYQDGMLLIASGNTLFYWKKTIPMQSYILGQKPFVLTLNSKIATVAFKTTNEILIGTENSEMQLVLLDKKMNIILQSNSQDPTAMIIPANPKIIITANSDSTVKIYAQQTCDILHEYRYADGECKAFVIIENILIGGFSDGFVRFWNLATLAQIGKAQICASGITSMASKDRTFILGNDLGGIFVISVLSCDPLTMSMQKVELGLEGSITSLDWTCENCWTVATSKGDIGVWEILGKLPAGNLSPEASCEIKTKDVWNIFENPHGVEVPQEDLIIYKEKQRHLVKSMQLKDEPDYSISICDSLQYLYIRDLVNHQIIRRVIIDIFPLKAVCLPIRNWVAIAGTDGTLKLKNLENLEEENVRAHYGPIQNLDIYDDGTHIVSMSKGEMIKWISEIDN